MLTIGTFAVAMDHILAQILSKFNNFAVRFILMLLLLLCLRCKFYSSLIGLLALSTTIGFAMPRLKGCLKKELNQVSLLELMHTRMLRLAVVVTNVIKEWTESTAARDAIISTQIRVCLASAILLTCAGYSKDLASILLTAGLLGSPISIFGSLRLFTICLTGAISQRIDLSDPKELGVLSNFQLTMQNVTGPPFLPNEAIVTQMCSLLEGTESTLVHHACPVEVVVQSNRVLYRATLLLSIKLDFSLLSRLQMLEKRGFFAYC